MSYGVRNKREKFAADYTGASQVVYEMKGMEVVFDGRACACHAAGSDEPRFMKEPQLAFSLNIKEIEAITGNDAKQIEKMISHHIQMTSIFLERELKYPHERNENFFHGDMFSVICTRQKDTINFFSQMYYGVKTFLPVSGSVFYGFVEQTIYGHNQSHRQNVR